MTSKLFSDWLREHRLKKKLTIRKFRKDIGLKRSYGWFCNLERTGEFAKSELEVLNKITEFFGYHLAFVPIQEELSKEEQKVIYEQYKKAEDEQIEKTISNRNW